MVLENAFKQQPFSFPPLRQIVLGYLLVSRLPLSCELPLVRFSPFGASISFKNFSSQELNDVPLPVKALLAPLA